MCQDISCIIQEFHTYIIANSNHKICLLCEYPTKHAKHGSQTISECQVFGMVSFCIQKILCTIGFYQMILLDFLVFLIFLLLISDPTFCLVECRCGQQRPSTMSLDRQLCIENASDCARTQMWKKETTFYFWEI